GFGAALEEPRRLLDGLAVLRRSGQPFDTRTKAPFHVPVQARTLERTVDRDAADADAEELLHQFDRTSRSAGRQVWTEVGRAVVAHPPGEDQLRPGLRRDLEVGVGLVV